MTEYFKPIDHDVFIPSCSFDDNGEMKMNYDRIPAADFNAMVFSGILSSPPCES